MIYYTSLLGKMLLDNLYNTGYLIQWVGQRPLLCVHVQWFILTSKSLLNVASSIEHSSMNTDSFDTRHV